MKAITQSLRTALPEAVETCAAAELLIPYIKEDTFVELPRLVGQEVDSRSQLSLLETFTPIQAGSILSSQQNPCRIVEESDSGSE